MDAVRLLIFGGGGCGGRRLLLSLTEEHSLAALERLVWAATLTNAALAMASAMTMLRTRSTDDYPYLACALTQLCLVSLHHSMLINNTPLVTLNLLSLAVWSFCVGSFIYTSPKKIKPLGVLAAGLALLLLLYGYLKCFCAVDSFVDSLATVSGSMGFVINCYPGVELVRVLKGRRARFDGVALVSGLFNGAVIYLYGYAVNDVVIYVPQLPQITIGTLKIILALKYSTELHLWRHEQVDLHPPQKRTSWPNGVSTASKELSRRNDGASRHSSVGRSRPRQSARLTSLLIGEVVDAGSCLK